MLPMTYRFLSPAKTPLLIMAVLALFSALPARADGLSIRFATEGTILPRRSHEVLTVESVNVERLDATILHIPESDTLAVLGSPDGGIPPEAQIVWHSQIEAKTGDAAPLPGQTVKTTLDVLQLVKPLQPGLYIADVHEVTTGKPRADARKLFMISNIGLQAFAGGDGLAVQARLLSEVNPAVNIEIALIARNNREIARVRSDGDGVARFDKSQISGKGADAAAALYAYGADGEFTALPITVPETDQPAPATAMIITDKQSYKPDEAIHGLVLVRNVDGTAANGAPVFVQLENSDGAVAQFQTAPIDSSGGFNLALHAPPASFAGPWTIRAYRNQDDKPVALGQTAIAVATGDAQPISPEKSDATPANTIIISPGRRSFQPGEVANISVQPPHDAYVTVALVDRSVRALVRQKISKGGTVIQLPIPADASSGMYIVATAFVPPYTPQNPSDAATPLQRSYGVQWIDIDEGAKRMSVRMDTPEHAEIGGKLPVTVTLQDLNDKTGNVQLVGSNQALTPPLDPLAFFYGRRPLQIQIYDSYAGVIGSVEPGVPDFSSKTIAPPSAPALLWPDLAVTSKSGKAEFSEIMPPLSGPDARLRLSAIAWSDDKLGYGESSVTATATKNPGRKEKQIAAAAIHTRAIVLKPSQGLTLKPYEAIIASIDPIIAAPVAYEADTPRFVTADMPQFRDYMLGLLSPADDASLLNDAILSFSLQAQNLDLPHVTHARLLDAVQAALAKPDVNDDQRMLAHYILLRGGRETRLEVAAWLGSNPQLSTLPAKAARLVLAGFSPSFKTDTQALQTAIATAPGSDMDAQAITLCLLAQANLPWPRPLIDAVAAETAKAHTMPPRTDLALLLAQAAHLNWGDPKLKPHGPAAFSDKTALKVENGDNRALYAWIVTGLPH